MCFDLKVTGAFLDNALPVYIITVFYAKLVRADDVTEAIITRRFLQGKAKIRS